MCWLPPLFRLSLLNLIRMLCSRRAMNGLQTFQGTPVVSKHTEDLKRLFGERNEAIANHIGSQHVIKTQHKKQTETAVPLTNLLNLLTSLENCLSNVTKII